MDTTAAELEAFARKSIGADAYPESRHTFDVYACEACGGSAFEVTVEPHTGSEDYDFRGIVFGECAQCGRPRRLLTYTGEHRQPLRRDAVRCECGNAQFVVALCERYEGDDGIPGFFDEGLVAGRCTRCGKSRIIVVTD